MIIPEYVHIEGSNKTLVRETKSMGIISVDNKARERFISARDAIINRNNDIIELKNDILQLKQLILDNMYKPVPNG